MDDNERTNKGQPTVLMQASVTVNGETFAGDIVRMMTFDEHDSVTFEVEMPDGKTFRVAYGTDIL